MVFIIVFLVVLAFIGAAGEVFGPEGCLVVFMVLGLLCLIPFLGH